MTKRIDDLKSAFEEALLDHIKNPPVKEDGSVDLNPSLMGTAAKYLKDWAHELSSDETDNSAVIAMDKYMKKHKSSKQRAN